jgi:hypothetical protein
MYTASKPMLLALTALMLLSACGQNTKTATLVTPLSQQAATLKWDEAVAASTTVKVNNSNLISMR